MADPRLWSISGFIGALLFAASGTDGDNGRLRGVFAETLAGPVSAKVERVIDGDTIEVEARIWLGQNLTIRIRIDGVDAPEMKARCPEERRMAEAARDYLVKRLSGAEIRLTRIVYDKYGGRVRADVADAMGDVGHALLAEGLARPYRGEQRGSWCGT